MVSQIKSTWAYAVRTFLVPRFSCPYSMTCMSISDNPTQEKKYKWATSWLFSLSIRLLIKGAVTGSNHHEVRWVKLFPRNFLNLLSSSSFSTSVYFKFTTGIANDHRLWRATGMFLGYTDISEFHFGLTSDDRATPHWSKRMQTLHVIISLCLHFVNTSIFHSQRSWARSVRTCSIYTNPGELPIYQQALLRSIYKTSYLGSSRYPTLARQTWLLGASGCCSATKEWCTARHLLGSVIVVRFISTEENTIRYR